MIGLDLELAPGHSKACFDDAIAEFPAERRAYVSLASLMGSLPASDRLISVSAMRALILRHLNEHGDTPDILDAFANLHRIEGNYRAFHEMTQSAIRKYPDHVGLRKSHAAAQEILLGLMGKTPSWLFSANPPIIRPSR